MSLQRRVGTRWQTVARPRLKRNGSFAAAHTFTTGRTEQWRAMVPASVHNLAAASATLRIKIAPLTGIHKIKHVVVIMQENRSFDSYFGTYPGRRRDPGRGVRARSGQRRLRRPVPRPLRPQLRRPALASSNAVADIDNGADGRVRRPGRAGDGLQLGGPELQPVHSSQARAQPARAST